MNLVSVWVLLIGLLAGLFLLRLLLLPATRKVRLLAANLPRKRPAHAAHYRHGVCTMSRCVPEL